MNAVRSVLSGSEQFLNTTSIVNALDVRPGMHIADFGCGSGYFTLELADRVGPDGRIYALDVQEQPLETVRSKAKAAGFANIETIRANLEVPGASSLPDNSQDMVFLANILFQSVKEKEIIQEAGRVLKSDGEIVLIDWKKNTPGFGPPDNLRKDTELLKTMFSQAGLFFVRTIDAGQFHFGMIFKK